MMRTLLTILVAWPRAAAASLVTVSLFAGACGGATPGTSGSAADPHEAEELHVEEAGEAGVVEVDATAQEQIQLRVARAEMRPVAATIRTTGTVGPDETRLARIRPLAHGLVERVFVRPGDRVRAGQVLLRYDNVEVGDLLAEWRTADAGVETAQAEADVAARTLERGTELVELGAISRADYERRQAEDAAARAALNAARARLANVRQKLQRFGLDEAALARAAEGAVADVRTELRAPFAGVVIAANVAEGELVDPERELLTVADLSTVWVQGDVYQQDLGAVTEGQVARVFVSGYPDEVFTGRITYVGDVLDPATRAAKVRCEVANPNGRLKLEMAATLEIPTTAERDAVAVPAAAVQRMEDETAVFVQVADTSFARRAVQIGVESDGWVEIVAGLSAGEPVVTQGAVMLKSKLMIGELGGHGH
ncbi:MAG: efflux RND transporter periplasmic adaptor subunit [Acidobacteria bacterium]|nr:efflux RND transporter periplasmic adaptor subunit [Acidobacteriota bacterium]